MEAKVRILKMTVYEPPQDGEMLGGQRKAVCPFCRSIIVGQYSTRVVGSIDWYKTANCKHFSAGLISVRTGEYYVRLETKVKDRCHG